MRILHVVAAEKWTGVGAVVADWTRALAENGIEAQCAFVGGSPLSRRLLPAGWARPMLSAAHGPLGLARDPGVLRQAIRRERMDVLHAHGTHDHALAVLAARGTGVRVFRTLHHIRHVRADALTRWLRSRTERVAFANRAIADAFGDHGPVHSPVVDTRVFAPGPRPAELPGGIRIPGDAFVVGTVGKLAAHRGFEEAIDAAASIPDAVALHCGQHTPHLPALRARAEARGTTSRNLWPGYRDEDLPVFYRAMDVFLFAASGSQQGQRAILEAMASGIPVVARDVPGVRDLVTDGVEGLVAPDAAGLPPALLRLKDPSLRARLGEASRRRALEFSAESFAAAARSFYGGGGGAATGSPGLPSGATSARPSDKPEGSCRPER